MGQRARLLVDADAVCLHCVSSGEGIGRVYHGADTFGLWVGQDTPGPYEVSARPKGDTGDEPSGRGPLVPSRADEAPALTAAAVASFMVRCRRRRASPVVRFYSTASAV